MISFGDRIKQLRMERQLKQDVFQAQGVTQSQLSQIENGHIPPSVEKIERIAAVLNCDPVDLVAGTDMEGKYFASRLTPDDLVTRQDGLKQARSRRIVAVDEAYKRIQLFHDLLYNEQGKRFKATVPNDAHYQHAARILRRATNTAVEFDADLPARLHVPESLLDELCLDNDDIRELRLRIEKSQAYVRSLVLEFSECDDSSTRLEIVKEIGLEKIDLHLQQYRIIDSVDNSGTWRPAAGFDNEALEDEIPF